MRPLVRAILFIAVGHVLAIAIAWVIATGTDPFDGTIEYPDGPGVPELLTISGLGSTAPGVQAWWFDDASQDVPRYRGRGGGLLPPTWAFPERLRRTPEPARLCIATGWPFPAMAADYRPANGIFPPANTIVNGIEWKGRHWERDRTRYPVAVPTRAIWRGLLANWAIYSGVLWLGSSAVGWSRRAPAAPRALREVRAARQGRRLYRVRPRRQASARAHQYQYQYQYRRMTDERDSLLARLQAIPKAERMDFLADLPREELIRFKRILPPDDIKKLTRHIDARRKRSKVPTVGSWLADARAGRAATPEAMVAVLVEIMDKLGPTDATWVRRLKDTHALSRRQTGVIQAIYRKYFDR